MANDFDRILDECIDRITRGETIEACLSDYPERAKQLEPLLQAMVQTKASYSFTPSADNKRAARERFDAALERTWRPSLLNSLQPAACLSNHAETRLILKHGTEASPDDSVVIR